MELNKIYKDKYNNRIKVISDDYTGLDRKIVFAQFIDRVKRIATKNEYVEKIRKNIFTPETFAIWHWEYENYTLIN